MRVTLRRRHHRESDFRQVAAHAGEEITKAFEQPRQVLPPSTELGDVPGDQVVSRRSQRGQAPVEPAKNREHIWSHHANGPSGSRRPGSMPLATR